MRLVVLYQLKTVHSTDYTIHRLPPKYNFKIIFNFILKICISKFFLQLVSVMRNCINM